MRLSLFTRDTIAQLLSIEPKYVYKLFNKKGIRGGLIPETVILDYLNDCGKNMSTLEGIPQLYTAEEMLEQNKSATLDNNVFDLDDLLRLGRRKLYPIPHFKLGKKTIRYPKYALSWWVSQISKPLKQRGTYNERTTREALLKLEE